MTAKDRIENYCPCSLLHALCDLWCCDAGAADRENLPHRFPGSSTASGSAVLLDAFRQELSKLGWIEGKNITIEYRFAEQKPERLPELAADLVRLKVDLIVVSDGRHGVGGQESDYYHPNRDGERLRTLWVQVWLPVWRGREAMSQGSRV